VKILNLFCFRHCTTTTAADATRGFLAIFDAEGLPMIGLASAHDIILRILYSCRPHYASNDVSYYAPPG